MGHLGKLSSFECTLVIEQSNGRWYMLGELLLLPLTEHPIPSALEIGSHCAWPEQLHVPSLYNSYRNFYYLSCCNRYGCLSECAEILIYSQTYLQWIKGNLQCQMAFSVNCYTKKKQKVIHTSFNKLLYCCLRAQHTFHSNVIAAKFTQPVTSILVYISCCYCPSILGCLVFLEHE